MNARRMSARDQTASSRARAISSSTEQECQLCGACFRMLAVRVCVMCPGTCRAMRINGCVCACVCICVRVCV